MSDFASSPSFKIKLDQLYFEDFNKPFFCCTESDFALRKELMAEMNAFYNKSDKFLDTYATNDFIAIFSDENWYRAQIKSIESSTKNVNIVYLDYGYSECLNKNEHDAKYRVKPLLETFCKHPSLVVGTNLVESSSSQSLIRITDAHKAIFEEFFSSFLEKTRDESLEIQIKCELGDDSGLFGIMIYNLTGGCLNEMIVSKSNVSQKQPALKTRPPLRRLKKCDLPAQSTHFSENEFASFVQRIDLFYLYRTEIVAQIQEQVQASCADILDQQTRLDAAQMKKTDMDEPPVKDEIVFGKYEDDQCWYRCVITNCDLANNKYELFYLDFGNTEIASRDEILYGWTEEHVSVFSSFEPQAYKCKLFSLEPVGSNLKSPVREFTQAQNSTFKEAISDKKVIPKLIKGNIDGPLEVSLKIVGEESSEFVKSSVHYHLVQNKTGKLFL